MGKNPHKYNKYLGRDKKKKHFLHALFTFYINALSVDVECEAWYKTAVKRIKDIHKLN